MENFVYYILSRRICRILILPEDKLQASTTEAYVMPIHTIEPKGPTVDEEQPIKLSWGT